MGAVIGGLIGYQQGEAGQNQADDKLRENTNLWKGIHVPTIEEQQLALLNPQYQGDFNAQQEALSQMGPSAMENIQADPRLQQAQMNALENLSQMGETGLMPGERAALNQARRSAAGEAQAKSAQIQSDMARRGMGGSGNELAARLQASQSSADRQSQENDRTMQMAQERALGAIGQSANLAGQMRGQDFSQQADVAKAKDYINQFNTQNQQSVQQRNIAAANQAGLRNLSEKQRIGEAGNTIQNQAQVHNKDLYQTKFANDNTSAGNVTGATTAEAARDAARGKRAADMWSNTGKGIDQGIGSMMMSDVRTKKNLKPFDSKNFLDKLMGYDFDYKDPAAHGEGKQHGILAQDLEKVMPEAVVETPKGRAIDSSKMTGPILANLADMHKRLKKMEEGS